MSNTNKEDKDLEDFNNWNSLDEASDFDTAEEAKYLGWSSAIKFMRDKYEKSHRWDSDGERCLDCGDKDWFASKHCSNVKTENVKQFSTNPSDWIDTE